MNSITFQNKIEGFNNKITFSEDADRIVSVIVYSSAKFYKEFKNIKLKHLLKIITSGYIEDTGNLYTDILFSKSDTDKLINWLIETRAFKENKKRIMPVAIEYEGEIIGYSMNCACFSPSHCIRFHKKDRFDMHENINYLFSFEANLEWVYYDDSNNRNDIEIFDRIRIIAKRFADTILERPVTFSSEFMFNYHTNQVVDFVNVLKGF